MRQQLESMMDSYQPMVSEQRQATYFVVGDLESLSASALYTPKISVPRVGTTLPGGLAIKSVGKNTLSLNQDFGGVGNIYTAHPDGHGALRFYGNEIVDGKKKGKDREKKQSSW
jgi:hypothetical protein